MTDLLLRLFIKDHTKTQDPAVHSAVGKLAGVVGILCNTLLFGVKLAVGLLSGAVSVVADALNNLSDAASSVVTLFGFRLAQRPADPDHPYGHARYEYLSGLMVAVLILVIGFELTKTAIQKMFMPTPVTFSVLTLTVLFCSMGVKLWMCFFYRKLGQKIGSAALKAVSVDSRNDVIASAGVFVGCLAGTLLQINVDGYIGLAVAAFILWSGIGVAKDTISPLLGQRADPKLTEQITNTVLSCDKVLGIHDLLVHDYGPGKCYASVHVELSAEEDSLVCHDIIDSIECDVLEKLNVHLVIHYDPVLPDDAEWKQMRTVAEKVVKDIDPNLSIHDFRLVRGACQTKLVFDLAVPYAMNGQHRQLRDRIDAAMQQCGKHYATVIRFDAQ